MLLMQCYLNISFLIYFFLRNRLGTKKHRKIMKKNSLFFRITLSTLSALSFTFSNYVLLCKCFIFFYFFIHWLLFVFLSLSLQFFNITLIALYNCCWRLTAVTLLLVIFYFPSFFLLLFFLLIYSLNIPSIFQLNISWIFSHACTNNNCASLVVVVMYLYTTKKRSIFLMANFQTSKIEQMHAWWWQ